MTFPTTLTRNATRALFGAALAASLSLAIAPRAEAASENECGIWLCMPAGFPGGCGDSFKAFKNRLKKGKSPLPSLFGCTDGQSKGTYDMGFEPFETCGPGFTTRDIRYDDDRGFGGISYMNAPDMRVCIDPQSCSTRGYGRDAQVECSNKYNAPRRADPWWVDMNIDGQDIGRYYYSR